MEEEQELLFVLPAIDERNAINYPDMPSKDINVCKLREKHIHAPENKRRQLVSLLPVCLIFHLGAVIHLLMPAGKGGS